MSWTYDPSLATPRDRVRLRIGDTDGATPLRTDEAINVLILVRGEHGAVEELCDGLASEYGQPVRVRQLPRIDNESDTERQERWSRRVSEWRLTQSGARSQRVAMESTAATSGLLTSSRPVRSDEPCEHAEYVRERGDFRWGG